MTILQTRSLRWRWAATVMIAAAVTLQVAPRLGTAAELSAGPPVGRGVLLVASPQLQDPNFRQAVILLCVHGPDGSLGVILNRQTDVLLSEALPTVTTLKGTSYRLFWGGPVQQTAVVMLFRTTRPPREARPVLEGVYLGGNPDTLDRVITRPEPTETFRAYAGYAGWAAGQLEAEMATGAWATVMADSPTIFDKDPAELWPDLLEQLIKPRTISTHHFLIPHGDSAR